ncbi:MAG: hypothetical protein DRN04_02935 [Thermoprotei archaeon]|nr:MAG: hypothetical protein DRN04_02935 [Thermoprotei archaeon]
MSRHQIYFAYLNKIYLHIKFYILCIPLVISLKVALSLSDVVYYPNEEVYFKITIKGALGGEKMLFKVIKDSVQEVFSQDYHVMPYESFIEDSVENLEEGFYEAQVLWSNSVVSLPFVVISPEKVKGKLLTVFHNHQAINKHPNGVYHGSWAFTHTWEDEFKPYYLGGVYFLHTFLLRRLPVRTCFNLSPSLLVQWRELLEKGVLLEFGSYVEYISPESKRAQIVKGTLNSYKRLCEENVVEVFSSFFAHPIAGFIIDYYGWLDIIEKEIKLGAKTTEDILGVKARGFWLPELFFSMRLIPLISKYGFEYTILDALNHFVEARGDKGTPYEPYRVRYNGEEIVVFFRNTELSDYLSFQVNKARNLQEAEAVAREYVLKILKTMIGSEDKVVTVALDGENWMILPQPSPEAAVAYEKILTYILSCEKKGYFRTILAKEVANLAERELTKIPTTTWLGSIAKWTSEKHSIQSKLWSLAERGYSYFKVYEEIFDQREELSYLVYCMMQILDSDMYWTEFINEEHITSWYAELSRIALSRINSLRIKGIRKMNDKIVIKIESPCDGKIILEVFSNSTRASRKLIELKSGNNFVEEAVRGKLVEVRLVTPSSLRLIRKPVRAVHE